MAEGVFEFSFRAKNPPRDGGLCATEDAGGFGVVHVFKINECDGFAESRSKRSQGIAHGGMVAGGRIGVGEGGSGGVFCICKHGDVSGKAGLAGVLTAAVAGFVEGDGVEPVFERGLVTVAGQGNGGLDESVLRDVGGFGGAKREVPGKGVDGGVITVEQNGKGVARSTRGAGGEVRIGCLIVIGRGRSRCASGCTGGSTGCGSGGGSFEGGNVHFMSICPL